MSGVYGGPAGIDMDAFIAAPPEQQKHMLSEVLLPRVQELHPELAGKIIGMLLEMDNNELINLGHDTEFRLEERIKGLGQKNPYTQTSYYQDSEGQHAPNDRIACVFISNFFIERTNLVYYIKGARNVEQFYGGMTGMQAFNGAVLSAVCAHNFAYVLKDSNLRPEEVVKSRMAIEASKWRYIYETGRLVWSKSGIDLIKLKEMMESKFDGGGPSRNGGPRSNGVEDIYDMDLDHKSTKSQRTAQSGEKQMSEKKRGKTKALQEDDRYTTNSGTSDLEPQDDTSEIDPDFGEELANPRIVEDWMILEMYKGTKQLDTVDDIWNSLKTNSLHNNPKMSEVRQNSVVDWLSEEVVYLTRREESFRQKLAAAPCVNRDAKITTELAGLENCIAADRLRLVQRVANEWFEKWKAGCEKELGKDLQELQGRCADKSKTESGLMDELILMIQDKTRGFDGTLESEELQNVIDLADNMELERDNMKEIAAGKINGASLKGLTALQNLETFLAKEKKIYITRLADTIFKHHNNLQVWKLPSTGQEEACNEGMAATRQMLVARVMESMGWNRELAIYLLEESDWVAEAAVARWFRGDTGLEVGSNPTAPHSRRTPPRGTTHPSQTLRKRSHMEEAGPDSPKKPRTGSSESQRPSVLEETPEAAQARLTRILGLDRPAEQSEMKCSQQETKKSAEASTEVSEPTVQGKSSAASKYYNLEVLNQMTANDAKAQVATSQNRQNANPNCETGSSDAQTSGDRRSSLRRRTQRVDYKVLNEGISPLAAAKQLNQAKKQTRKMEAEKGTPNEKRRTQQSPSYTSVLFTSTSPAEVVAVSAKGTEPWRSVPGDMIPGASEEWHSNIRQVCALTQQNIEHTQNQRATMARQASEQPSVPVNLAIASDFELLIPIEDFDLSSPVRDSDLSNPAGHHNFSDPIWDPNDARFMVRSRSSSVLTSLYGDLPQTLIEASTNMAANATTAESASTQQDPPIPASSHAHTRELGPLLIDPDHPVWPLWPEDLLIDEASESWPDSARACSQTSHAQVQTPDVDATEAPALSQGPPLTSEGAPDMLPPPRMGLRATPPVTENRALKAGPPIASGSASEMLPPSPPKSSTSRRRQPAQRVSRASSLVDLSEMITMQRAISSVPRWPQIPLEQIVREDGDLGAYMTLNGHRHFYDLSDYHSPPLPVSSGPSDSSERDSSLLSENSPPPNTQPNSAVLGHQHRPVNEIVASVPPPEAKEVGHDGQSDDEQDQSGQMMGIDSGMTLRQALVDAAADRQFEVQHARDKSNEADDEMGCEADNDLYCLMEWGDEN